MQMNIYLVLINNNVHVGVANVSETRLFQQRERIVHKLEDTLSKNKRTQIQQSPHTLTSLPGPACRVCPDCPPSEHKNTWERLKRLVVTVDHRRQDRCVSVSVMVFLYTLLKDDNIRWWVMRMTMIYEGDIWKTTRGIDDYDRASVLTLQCSSS